MWRVTHRVHFPTLALGILWIIHSVATTMYVPWQNARQREALEARFALMEAAQQLHENVTEWLVIRNDSSAIAQREQLHRQIEQQARKLESQSADPVVRESLRRIQADLHTEKSGEDQLIRSKRMIAECQHVMQAQQRQLIDLVDQRSRTDSIVMIVRAVLLVLGLLIGIGLAMWMARGLQQSISQISVSLRGAEGELATHLGLIDVVSQGPSQELTSLESQVANVLGRIRSVAEELQQTRQEMIRAERLAAVGEVAAAIAHEIRNPLTSVKLLIQWAANQRPLRSLNDEQLQVLLEEVSKIETTVQSLLDFARPELPHKIVCPISPIVSRTLALLEGRFRSQHIRVENVAPSESDLVRCDPRLIQQVLVNLLINALDAISAEGAISIRERIDLLEQMVIIEVEDSGPGIAGTVQQRLFEPFVTTRPQGSGLGLAISRRIIEEHGGQLTAVNSTHGGAVFILRLPLVPSDMITA